MADDRHDLDARLDRAVSALVDDVARRSSAPGAAAAVRTARRRRVALVSGVAALVLALVGGTAALTGGAGRWLGEDPAPAQHPPGELRPAPEAISPGALSPASLDRATHGWLDAGWEVPEGALGTPASGCPTAVVPGRPTRAQMIFSQPNGAWAEADTGWLSGREEAREAYQSAVRRTARCAASSRTVPTATGEATVHLYPPRGPVRAVWIASVGDGVTILHVWGTDADPGDTVQQQVARALVADLLARPSPE